MPNWCNNYIAIYRDDDTQKSKGQLRELYLKLRALLDDDNSTINKELKAKDIDKNWYGNILVLYGKNDEDIAYRGTIEEVVWEGAIDEDGGWIRIQTETAWDPQIEIIKSLIDDYCPNLTFEYVAEEPGCEIYVNTDVSGRFFLERYVINYDFNAISGYSDDEYLKDETEFLNSAKDILNDFKECVSKLSGVPEFKIKDFAEKPFPTEAEEAWFIIEQIKSYIEENISICEDLQACYLNAHEFDKY